MTAFGLRTDTGEVFLVEAVDRTDAQLFGLREVRGFERVMSEEEARSEIRDKLRKGFLLNLGMTEAQAEEAAGKLEADTKPMIEVPRQEAKLVSKERKVTTRKPIPTASRTGMKQLREEASSCTGQILRRES